MILTQYLRSRHLHLYTSYSIHEMALSLSLSLYLSPCDVHICIIYIYICIQNYVDIPMYIIFIIVIIITIIIIIIVIFIYIYIYIYLHICTCICRIIQRYVKLIGVGRETMGSNKSCRRRPPQSRQPRKPPPWIHGDPAWPMFQGVLYAEAEKPRIAQMAYWFCSFLFAFWKRLRVHLNVKPHLQLDFCFITCLDGLDS